MVWNAVKFLVKQGVEFPAGFQHLDFEIFHAEWKCGPNGFAEHSHFRVEGVARCDVGILRGLVDPLDEVADEAGDVGELVEIDPLHVILRVMIVLTEPPRAHGFSQKERRFLGIEEGDDEIPLQRTKRVGLGNHQSLGDGGGVVIDAGRIDHAVVVGTD